MTENKRIMITLPQALLEELDVMVNIEHKNRSQFIREAMRFYLREKKKAQLREEMRRGYQEMAWLNLRLCEEAFECEEEVRISIEGKLVECC